MIVRTLFLCVAGAVALFACAAAADDMKEDPLRDISIGMQGLEQAAQDPALMAQLLQDLQVRLRYAMHRTSATTTRDLANEGVYALAAHWPTECICDRPFRGPPNTTAQGHVDHALTLRCNLLFSSD